MSIGDVTVILRQAILQILATASPLLITALVVGLTVAILQATTSIQEQTLVFVPKVICILIVLALLGGYIFTSLREYTINLFSRIQDMAR